MGNGNGVDEEHSGHGHDHRKQSLTDDDRGDSPPVAEEDGTEQDRDVSAAPPDDLTLSGEEAQETSKGTVIGGIRCRLERVQPASLPCPCAAPARAALESSPSGFPSSSTTTATTQIYIQTLTLLAPYRNLSIASALLGAIVEAGIAQYGATSIYAHVWEANDEALDWYRRRGFEIGELVLGYYRRLKPDGARLVRRRLGVQDFLAIKPGLDATTKGVRRGDGGK